MLPRNFKVQSDHSDVPNQPFDVLAESLGLEACFGWKEAFLTRLWGALASAYEQGVAAGSKKPLARKRPSKRMPRDRFRKMKICWSKEGSND